MPTTGTPEVRIASSLDEIAAALKVIADHLGVLVKLEKAKRELQGIPK